MDDFSADAPAAIPVSPKPSPPTHLRDARTIELAACSVRLLLTERYSLLRDGLAAIFKAAAGFEVIAAPATPRSVCAATLRHRPDVAVLGVGSLDARLAAALRRFKDAAPGCKVVVVLSTATGGGVRGALDAGVEGLLPKTVSAPGLVGAVRTVVDGVPCIAPDLERLAADPATGPLTAREEDVLALMARGENAKEIATELVLSVGTVRNHITAILRKLCARTQLDAVLIAEQQGWIKLTDRLPPPTNLQCH